MASRRVPILPAPRVEYLDTGTVPLWVAWVAWSLAALGGILGPTIAWFVR